MFFSKNKQENEQQQNILKIAMNTAAGMLADRYSAFTKMLGTTFGGNRDYYAAMGYPRDLFFRDYYFQYSRNGIGKRIIKSFPNACWRFTPAVRDADKGKDSEFQKAFKQLATKTKLFKYLKKGDQLSRIGQYGVIFMGFNDGLAFDQAVADGSKLVYLQAYTEDQASITSYETDTKNPRYGKPLMYSITSAVTGQSPVGTVHYSRILHLAEETEGNDIFGTPALKGVFNNVRNIDMISAAATEGYWRGGFAGIVAEVDKDADYTPEDKADFAKDMKRYVDGFQKTLIAQGGTFKFPQASVLQPTAFLDAQYDIVAADTQIPKRILTGSELAEVASTQDAGNWNNVVDDRRINYCEPDILRAFIDIQIEIGALPKPLNGEYVIDWPDMEGADEKRNSETALNKSKALTSYANSEKAQSILSKERFLIEVMGIE